MRHPVETPKETAIRLTKEAHRAREASLPHVQVFLDLTAGKPMLPVRFHAGDAGFDLYVSRDAIVPVGVTGQVQGQVVGQPGFLDVHTDVYLSFPPELYGRITGRSSTVRKRGLQVVEGIIDSDYTGEMMVGVWNLTGAAIRLQAGDRIAQLIIHRHVTVLLHPIDHRPEGRNGRGTNGFGSTGG